MWPKAFVTTPRKCENKDICTMTSFYYYDQNPSSFIFFCKLRFLLFNPRRDLKRKTKKNLVLVIK